MAEHEKFHYDNLAGLRQDIERLNVAVPVGDSLTSLKLPLRAGDFRAANRLTVLPMEGCDGQADGKPGELTERRYLRFAAGGAGTAQRRAGLGCDAGGVSGALGRGLGQWLCRRLGADGGLGGALGQ